MDTCGGRVLLPSLLSRDPALSQTDRRRIRRLVVSTARGDAGERADTALERRGGSDRRAMDWGCRRCRPCLGRRAGMRTGRSGRNGRGDAPAHLGAGGVSPRWGEACGEVECGACGPAGCARKGRCAASHVFRIPERSCRILIRALPTPLDPSGEGFAKHFLACEPTCRVSAPGDAASGFGSRGWEAPPRERRSLGLGVPPRRVSRQPGRSLSRAGSAGSCREPGMGRSWFRLRQDAASAQYAAGRAGTATTDHDRGGIGTAAPGQEAAHPV